MRERSIRKEVGVTYYVVAGAAFCLIVGLLAWKVTDHFTRPTVVITVDNNLDGPVEIVLDDRPRGAVAPGTAQTFLCRHGQRRLVVTKEGVPVFTLGEALAALDKGDRPRPYLLNLGGAGRYRTYDAEYGVSMRLDMPKIKMDFPWQTEEDRRREEMRVLSEKIKLVELPEWSDVSSYDVIFERPPKVVQGALIASKKVLARVTPADHGALKGAAAKKAPTAQDVAELRAVVQRLLDEERPAD